MTTLRIGPVRPADWPALAPFLFARNRIEGDVRCLHSRSGVDLAPYAEELRTLPPDEGRYFASHAGEKVVGVAGAELDVSLGRAWLLGPVVAGEFDYAKLAAELLRALCDELPLLVTRHDVFVSERWSEGLAFFRAQGFGGEAVFDEITVAQPPRPTPLPPGVRLASAQRRWYPTIGALHDEEFPSAYITADGLFAQEGKDAMTRVALLGDAPVGYVRVHLDPQWREGYVDFLAVLPAVRGRGIGGALLTEALRWSLAQPGIRAVSLTVRKDRLPARALYASAGFRRVRTCIGLRRVLRRQC